MTLTSKAKVRKLMLASGLGFAAGACGMMGFLALGVAPVLDLERVVVGGVGVVYLMTGLFTLLGASLPGLGARVLNVADREELIELRAVLNGSAITVISVGAMLLALAGSGPGGTVPGCRGDRRGRPGDHREPVGDDASVEAVRRTVASAFAGKFLDLSEPAPAHPADLGRGGPSGSP